MNDVSGGDEEGEEDRLVSGDKSSRFSYMSDTEMNDGPENTTHAHEDNDVRKDKEGTVVPPRMVDCKVIPRPIVFMSHQKEQATAKQLYDDKNRRNIKKMESHSVVARSNAKKI